jgi:predicted Zn-dependent protease
MMPLLFVLLPSLLGFGLGDLVEIIESDEVSSAVTVVESFSAAARKITDTEEYYLGRSVAANVLAIYTPLESEGLQDYINVAGSTLACFTPKPAIFGGYHFLVVDSDDINALACPGGCIFICTGLLDLVDNEEELACILAHELAHVSLEHGINSIGSARWTSAFTTLGTEAITHLGSDELREATENYGDIVDDITTNLITSGYSRDSEKQADSLAVYIVAAAGYDPGAMISVLEKMSAVSDRSGPGFWQTHPSPEDRIDYVEEILGSGGFPNVPAEDIAVRTDRFQSATAGTWESSSAAGTSRSGSSTGSGSSTPDTSTSRGGTAGSSGESGSSPSPSGERQ